MSEQYREQIYKGERVVASATYKNEVLNERQTTHGDYADNAHTAQTLKDCIRRGRNYDQLNAMQKESLAMSESKSECLVSFRQV